MLSLNRKIGLIFAGAVLTRMLFFHLTGFVADDAFITFRYAENLAHGLGFVYNLGEPVLGTTTPLFTLILACLNILGLNVPSAALTVSLVCSGLTATVIYRFALHLRFTIMAWLPTVAYIIWPRSLTVDTGGMETALFTLLITAAFYYQAKRLPINALALSTLSALTRPEGFFVVAILLAVNLYREPHRWRQYLVVTGLLLLPWLIFATIYFGSPIPNSAIAKAALYAKLGSFGIWETLVYFMAWHTPFGWLMSLMALVGGYWLNKKQNFGWPAIIFLAGLISFYCLSRARMFFWYIGPIYPLYFIFATAAVCWAVARFEWLRQKRTLVRNLTLIGLCLLLGFAWRTPVFYYSRLQEAQMSAHYEVAVYLATQVADYELVAAEDIGYMGYYSKKRILDRDGLVSPEVIPYNRNENYLGLINDFKPEWVVTLRTSWLSQFYNTKEFLDDYQLEKTFETERFVYDLFRQRETENRQEQK